MSETALQPDLHPEATPAGPETETGPSAAEAGGILAINLPAIEANWKDLGRRAMPSECAAVIKADPAFAAAYAAQDIDAYKLIVVGMARTVFDRDTAPGAEPEELRELDIPAWIVPGNDESHATSAARYLEECLPRAEYWDALPEAQTAESAPPRLLDFLARAPKP